MGVTLLVEVRVGVRVKVEVTVKVGVREEVVVGNWLLVAGGEVRVAV